MPNYLIDVTFLVEGDSQQDAWKVANDAAHSIEQPDFQVDYVSEPWEVDTTPFV